MGPASSWSRALEAGAMPNFGTRRRQLLKTLALNRIAIYSWRRKPHTSSSSETVAEPLALSIEWRDECEFECASAAVYCPGRLGDRNRSVEIGLSSHC